jgi:hypothetical protein
MEWNGGTMETMGPREVWKQIVEYDDRPVQSVRMVGSRRVEVWYLGDMAPHTLELREASGGTGANAVRQAKPEAQPADETDHADEQSKVLQQKTVKELRQMAREVGISYSGLRKADLIQALVGEG